MNSKCSRCGKEIPCRIKCPNLAKQFKGGSII